MINDSARFVMWWKMKSMFYLVIVHTSPYELNYTKQHTITRKHHCSRIVESTKKVTEEVGFLKLIEERLDEIF